MLKIEALTTWLDLQPEPFASEVRRYLTGRSHVCPIAADPEAVRVLEAEHAETALELDKLKAEMRRLEGALR